ncbi:hypothetical protein M1146_06870 [Patescibacteria group bacterium]|nr:hypothetical protein [Patescibacteria group bacterium]
MEEFNSADILKKQNRKKRLAFLEVGLFEISFVLIIIIVLFGILNYFNILSLSTLYPNQLAFLPHIPYSQNKTTQDVFQKPQLAIPVFKRLTNQATEDKISKYLSYMKTHSVNLQDPNPLIAIANGAFSGYSKDTIQITTANNVMNFLVASETAILTVEEPQSPIPSSVPNKSLKVSSNYTLLELVGKIKFGDILQVSYLKTSPEKATEIIFRTNSQTN